MKVCNRCHGELPATLEYFHISRSNKDGLFHECKECRRGKGESVVTASDFKKYKLGKIYKIKTAHRREWTEFKGVVIQDTERFVTLRNKKGIVESFLKGDLATGIAKVKEVI